MLSFSQHTEDVVAVFIHDDIKTIHQQLQRLAHDPQQFNLHQLRVSIRRSVSLLTIFAPAMQPHQSLWRNARRRLRKLAKATNALRDQEVQSEWLATYNPTAAETLSWRKQYLKQD